MRSIAEIGKDCSLVHTAAAALVVGVVLRHRAAAAPVPASLCMPLRHTTRRKAQPTLGQQMVFCTTVAQIQ